MPIRIGADDVDTRVTVRRWADQGRARTIDVVGDLEVIDASRIVVRGRDGELVEVATADVVAAKTVGPSPLAARELEGVSARGWPAPDTAWLGDWWLRAAGGFSARANSVRPLGEPDRELDDAFAYVADWYAQRSLPARIQVVSRSRLDVELARRGWTAAPDVAVLTAPVRRVLERLAADGSHAASAPPRVSLTAAPSDDWLGFFRGGHRDDRATAVLTGSERARFAAIETAGGVVAIGRSALEAPWVGISAVEVAPAHRHRGLAKAVLYALLTEAREAGARQVYLEALVANAVAQRLYGYLGCTLHHHYRCRARPDDDRAA